MSILVSVFFWIGLFFALATLVLSLIEIAHGNLWTWGSMARKDLSTVSLAIAVVLFLVVVILSVISH